MEVKKEKPTLKWEASPAWSLRLPTCTRKIEADGVKLETKAASTGNTGDDGSVTVVTISMSRGLAVQGENGEFTITVCGDAERDMLHKAVVQIQKDLDKLYRLQED